MLPLLLAGKGLLGKHWGKIVALGFVLLWATITLGLYNSNNDLRTELAQSSSATEVCITQRKNMDNVLLLLKADIALIQADNAEYKARLQQAGITIQILEESMQVVITDIDTEVIPESCEGTMGWMLEKALEQ
jgi:hypothetical protein